MLPFSMRWATCRAQADHGAGGDSGEQPLLLHERSRCPEGLLAVDHDAPVEQGEVQDGGYEPLLQAAQAHDHVLRVGGHGDDADGGVVLLEAAAPLP